LDRDPRNSDHIRAAIQLISDISENYATERTFTELAAFGIALPKGIKKWKKVKPHDAMIGAFFHLDRGLIFPDNVILTCADCHIPVEIRPHSNVGSRVMCCFCTVDQALRQYWEEHASRD
jgi:hypothetical protein